MSLLYWSAVCLMNRTVLINTLYKDRPQWPLQYLCCSSSSSEFAMLTICYKFVCLWWLITCHNFFEGTSYHESQSRSLLDDRKFGPDHQESYASTKHDTACCYAERHWTSEVGGGRQDKPEFLCNEGWESHNQSHHCRRQASITAKVQMLTLLNGRVCVCCKALIKLTTVLRYADTRRECDLIVTGGSHKLCLPGMMCRITSTGPPISPPAWIPAYLNEKHAASHKDWHKILHLIQVKPGWNHSSLRWFPAQSWQHSETLGDCL